MSATKFGRSANLRGVRSGQVISRYVKKNAFFAMLFAVLGLWVLQLIFAYLGELDSISDSYGYFDALKYIFYKSPYFFEQFTPTGALLGAVIGLGLLANNSELIVMRAAGLSTYRIVGWVLQPAIIFVIIALAVNQYVLPETNLKANQIRKPDTALLASVDGYWTLQNAPSQGNSGNETGDNGYNIIYIDYADANGNIGKVKRWHLDENNRLTAVSEAAGGVYLSQTNQQQDSGLSSVIKADQDLLNYKWELVDVTTLNLEDHSRIGATEDNNTKPTKQKQSRQYVLNNDPLAIRQTQSEDVMSLPISPSSVYLLTRSAEDLSVTQLYEHKLFNDSQGTRSLEHEVALWQKLLSPLAILSLVIVACSFVFGSLRTHSLGLRIVVALVFGLLFSYMQDLTSFVSLATGASPLLMVLLPIIASTALGLYLIKRQG